MTVPINTIICSRCGNCCIDVGRTFWKNGNFVGYPELDELKRNGDHEDGSLPCEMLCWVNGKAFCLIYNIRPEVCREHDGGERCG